MYLANLPMQANFKGISINLVIIVNYYIVHLVVMRFKKYCFRLVLWQEALILKEEFSVSVWDRCQSNKVNNLGSY